MPAKGKVEVEIVGKDQASPVFGRIGGNLTKLGKIATGIGVVGAAGLFAITKAAADFEGKMREVNTMLGVSEGKFQDISKAVLNLSSDLGIAAGEISEALYQIVSAGVDAANQMLVLEVAGKAAVAGVTDIITAADGLTTILNAFKISASDSQRVADVLFTTVKRGKTTFEELSASMFNVAPIAATAGIDFEQVAAAIATITKQGVPTKIATTQLRAAIQAIIKPTEQMSKAISKAGYVSGEAMIEKLGFADAIGVLTDQAGGSLQVLGEMFGSIEGLSAILSLTGENTITFEEDLAAAYDSVGAMTEALDEINKGAAKTWNDLLIRLQNLGIELGTNLLPILSNIVSKFAEVIEKVSEWIGEHPELTEALVKFGAALTAIMAVGGPMLLMAPTIMKIISAGLLFTKFIWATMIPALIRLAMTFIATLAAMGPAGWAAIAAGVGVAAAGIYGLQQVLGEKSVGITPKARAAIKTGLETGVLTPEQVPSYQHGGIVPGPIGKPIPVIAHGGEAFLGEGGEALGRSISINVGNFLGDETALRDFVRAVKEVFGEDTRRNTFGPVNQGYFFGRSSL